MLTALSDRRLVGRTFGGYRLECVLGQGRFSTCYRARREDAASEPNAPVVMKLVKPQGGRMDAEAVWAECQVLQACSHPGVPAWLGIVNLDETGETFAGGASARKPYFIVESLMPGDSLAYWLQKRGHEFGLDEVRVIGLQIIGILEHLAQRGITHGDLRPANVMYDGQQVSLIDFGLSNHRSIPADFAQDRDGLAGVLLFLLYSDDARIRSGVKATWREELVLPSALRQFLENLFSETHEWRDYAEVRARFAAAMGAHDRLFEVRGQNSLRWQ